MARRRRQKGRTRPRIHWDFVGVVLLLGVLGGFGIYALRGGSEEVGLQGSPEVRLQEQTEGTGLQEEPQIAEFSANTLEQGDTFVITLPKDLGGGAVAYVNGELVRFAEFADKWVGIYGIHGKAPTGLYEVAVLLPEGKEIPYGLNVKKRDFPITKLVFSEDLQERGYSEEGFAQELSLDAKVERLQAVLREETPEALFTEPFLAPVENPVIVGAFGNIRAGENYAFHHWGVDLRADTGDPVYAANSGRVAFAQEGVYSFGTVLVLDHGFGIYSNYLHLSELLVQEGETIEKGRLIGRAGSTGYALAPHLHFEVKVRGAAVDPLRFIEAVR